MHSFAAAKQIAIEQLHEMSKKAVKPYAQQQHKNDFSANKTIKNFHSSYSNDDLLILSLMLLLYGDCHDKWLFLALLYILL